MQWSNTYICIIYIYIHGFVTPKQKVLEQLGIHTQKQNKTKQNTTKK